MNTPNPLSRYRPRALLAAAALCFGLTLAPADTTRAQTMSCLPGMENLPGCDGGSGGFPGFPIGDLPIGGIPGFPIGDLPIGDLPGFPIGDLPIGGIPGFPIGDLPGGGIPGFPIGDLPIGGFPGFPIGDMPGFDLPGLPIGGLPGGDIPGWKRETIAGMSTYLYVPDSAPALAGKRALMINLHGCGQSNAVLASAGNWVETADKYGMVVVAPLVPNGGVYAQCWDYYDSNHSRSNPSRHDDDLLNLVSSLLANDSLNIDPNQVYISGLSSGGGQAMVMGCLAPDVFAGIGLNAGPTVGSGPFETGMVNTNLTTASNLCRNFAGQYAEGFDTQLTSVIYGDNDTFVAPGYNTLNGQVMAHIYGASSTSKFDLTGLEGKNTNGSGTLYSDGYGPRVSVIQNTGMGHNWPAGAGTGGSFVTANSINYPAYVTAFFFENNRRVDRSVTNGQSAALAPVAKLTAPADGASVSGTVTIAASASAAAGISRVEFYVDGALVGSDSSAPYEYRWNTAALGNGSHVITVKAYDADGNAGSDTATVTVSNGVAAATAGLYCGAATNLEHKNAGRATSYSIASQRAYYGKGSLAYLGTGDSTVTTLKETANGQFIKVASCN